MKSKIHHVIKTLIPAIVVVTLSSCGGGGEGETASPPPVSPGPVTPPVVVQPPPVKQPTWRYIDIQIPSEKISNIILSIADGQDKPLISLSEMKVWSDGKQQSVAYFDINSLTEALEKSVDKGIRVHIDTADNRYSGFVMAEELKKSARAISVNPETSFLMAAMEHGIGNDEDEIENFLHFMEFSDRNGDAKLWIEDITYHDAVYARSSRVADYLYQQQEAIEQTGSDVSIWEKVANEYQQSLQVWPFVIEAKQTAYETLRLSEDQRQDVDGFIRVYTQCEDSSSSSQRFISVHDAFDVPINCALTHAMCIDENGGSCGQSRSLYFYDGVWTQSPPSREHQKDSASPVVNLNSLLEDAEFKTKYAEVVATTLETDPPLLKNIRICSLLKSYGQDCDETTLN